MLSGFLAAARRARTETRGARAAERIAPGAVLTWRDTERGAAVTAVLPEGREDRKAALERALAEAGAARVLVVATAAAKPAAAPTPQAAGPGPALGRGGHANPLGLSPSGPKQAARPEKARPRGVRRVLAVASGKGGVGKSSIAARIALALRADGQRAGLLDLDVYGPSVPLLFGAHEKPEMADGALRPLRVGDLPLLSIGLLVDDSQALAWRGPMVMGAVKQLTGEADWTGSDGQDGPLDWLVIDTPPGTGDAHLSLIQRVVLDAAVIVTTPSPLALADVARGRQLFKRTGVPVIGLIENMASPDGPFGDGLSDKQLADLGLGSLVKLPLDPALGALPAEGGDLGLDLFAPVIAALRSVDSSGGPS